MTSGAEQMMLRDQMTSLAMGSEQVSPRAPQVPLDRRPVSLPAGE